MFRDTVKSRWLNADGVYRRREIAPGETPYRAQQDLQDQARRAAAVASQGAGVALTPEQGQR
jgi:hypothetical protein